MQKKKILAVGLASLLAVTSIGTTGVSAESTSMKVGKRTVYISSRIDKSTANASTGSDMDISAKVSSKYYAAKNGKILPVQSKTGRGSKVATVAFSAPSGSVSKSITSSHSASWNGAKGSDVTAASR